ncbi:MAG TPA: sigma-70 family RNA polymerase sigma factor [Vicinamibacterales bacterium]
MRSVSATGGDLPADSTFELLERARGGDDAALNVLFARYAPRLMRWASGRLPRWARDAADTSDLVQDTLLQTFKQIDRFEPRREGALQAYLRQAVMNRIRNCIRDSHRRPSETGIDEAIPAENSSPLETAIGSETFERYEAALATLRDVEREAIIGRVELGCTYEELADMLELPSADAARKASQRALLRLARAMDA